MEPQKMKESFFRRRILNSKFVVYTLIIFILAVTLFALSKVTFVLYPIAVLIRTIFLPMLLAGICFYLFNPIVDWLEKRGVKRLLSILMLYVVVIGIITLLVISVIPFLREQINSLISNLPTYGRELKNIFYNITGSNWVEQASQKSNFDLSKLSKDISQNTSKYIAGFSHGLITVVGTVTEIVLSVVVLPFILFYLLKDGRKLPGYVARWFPNRINTNVLSILGDMNQALSNYIRGQIFVSLCVGTLLYIGYLIIGLDYALLLAIIAMLTNVVPYIGPIIAISPAIIIAIVTSPFMIVKLAIVWVIVQLLESKIISPQVMGKSLHIHPITVIFVILTAGNLFGLAGIILAIPGYAILKVIVLHLYRIIKLRTNIYSDSPKKD